MNIAVVILWYLIGYVGCIWSISRVADITAHDLGLFFLFAVLGPIAPVIACFSTGNADAVVIRRRK
jgi:hypothetical protein